MEVKLRKYQEKVAPKVFKYLAANKGCHPLVGMPTGAGKSYCIADVIEQAVRKWDVDVVVLSHVKEIVEQDYNSIKKFIPDVGLYSAGLKTKEIKKVTVAGIQSAYRKPELFRSKSKKPLLVIIDEAHLIPKKEIQYVPEVLHWHRQSCKGWIYSYYLWIRQGLYLWRR